MGNAKVDKISLNCLTFSPVLVGAAPTPSLSTDDTCATIWSSGPVWCGVVRGDRRRRYHLANASISSSSFCLPRRTSEERPGPVGEDLAQQVDSFLSLYYFFFFLVVVVFFLFLVGVFWHSSPSSEGRMRSSAAVAGGRTATGQDC